MGEPLIYFGFPFRASHRLAASDGLPFSRVAAAMPAMNEAVGWACIMVSTR